MVANMSIVDDAQFTALSVSAQHWLKISEVFWIIYTEQQILVLSMT